MTRSACFVFLLLTAVLALPGPGRAVNPDEMLANPVLEARAREISKELRCLVCQNQSIDDSDAQLAKDLRLLVRERLTAGDSDRQVIDYVVSRYGDFVLLKPPFKATTLALWLGPATIVGFGVLALVLYYRRRPRAAATGEDRPPPLSDDEKRRLEALLKDDTR
jgi:cytochrome c-type biogenesis protein CcmH